MKGNWQGNSLTAPRLQIPALLLVFEHLRPRQQGAQSDRQAGSGRAGGREEGWEDRCKVIRPQQRSKGLFLLSCFLWKEDRRSSGLANATRSRPGLPGQGKLGTHRPILCGRLLCQRPEETASRKWQRPKTPHVKKNRAAVRGSGLVREYDNWYQMQRFCFRAYWQHERCQRRADRSPDLLFLFGMRWGRDKNTRLTLYCLAF